VKGGAKRKQEGDLRQMKGTRTRSVQANKNVRVLAPGALTGLCIGGKTMGCFKSISTCIYKGRIVWGLGGGYCRDVKKDGGMDRA
jgi:hypothetical protein